MSPEPIADREAFSDAPAPPPPRDFLRLSPAVALLGLALVKIAAPFLPISSQFAADSLGALLTLFYVTCMVGFALLVARREFSLWASLALMVFGALFWCGVEYGMQPRVDAFLEFSRLQGAAPTPLQAFTLIYVSALRDLALIVTASFAGAALARGIRYPNMLGPIGAVIALIDIWGVMFGGIVHQMLTSQATQPLAAKAMTTGPQIGAVGASQPAFSISLPSIGIGDFLFLALLLCTLVYLRMNWKASAVLMFAFVSVALLGLTFLTWFPALPGLLFIGAGAVLPNLKYFSFTREEKWALFWAGLLVLFLTMALYFGLQSVISDTP